MIYIFDSNTAKFITDLLYSLPGIIIGLAFHEFAHAFVADKLGDPTPRSQGRLTIAPQAHIDPVGFIFLIFARFGWGRPVMVDRRYFKKPVRDDILVSIAGPVMNILLAIAFCLSLKILHFIGLVNIMSKSQVDILDQIFLQSAFLNICLAIFNILPIPPLDGSHILINIIAPDNYQLARTLQKYGTVIFIVLVLSSYLNLGILEFLLYSPAEHILYGIMGIIRL